jgi:hypothetical protein
MIDHLYQHHPCHDCPFRKDTWIVLAEITDKLRADTFVCHNQREKQCSGHMIFWGKSNKFVLMAYVIGIELELLGSELLFENIDDLETHHMEECR